MTSEFEELRSFAREIVESYEESTELENISNLKEFNEISHSHRNFLQYGKRSDLPKRFFQDEGVVLQPLIQQFIDSITTGEVVGVLSSIRTAAEQGEIDSFKVSEFSYDSIVVNSFEHVYDPDIIFLPNSTEFRMRLQEWRSEGQIKTKEDGAYIAGASDIKVKWMPSKWGIDDIILYSTEDVNVIQKRYADGSYPTYIDPVDGFNAAKPEDRLMVYVGEGFDEDSQEDAFELLIRSVISEPHLTGTLPHGATVIKLPEQMLPDKYH